MAELSPAAQRSEIVEPPRVDLARRALPASVPPALRLFDATTLAILAACGC